MVVTKIDFSRPRRFVFSSLELPKPAPSDAPLCCSKINKIVNIAETSITTSRKLPKFIITPVFHYSVKQNLFQHIFAFQERMISNSESVRLFVDSGD